MSALLVVSAIWGAHAVIGAEVERVLSPLALAMWRFTFAALVFAPAFFRAGKRLRALSRRDVGLLGASAVLWAVLYPLLYYHSLKELSPVESLLIVNTAPALAALFGFLLYRERLTIRQVTGLFVALAGVGAVGWHVGSLGFGEVWAALLAFGGTASFALYTVLSRDLFRRLPLFDVLAVTTLSGAAMLWLYAVVTAQSVSVFFALQRLTLSGWLQFGFIVVFVSVLAYVLYGYGLARVSAGAAAGLTFYPQVMFAALLQWIMMGKAPGTVTIIGGAVILFGVFLLQKRRTLGKTPTDLKRAL